MPDSNKRVLIGYKKREMEEIYESLEWVLKGHLESADSVVQRMFYEMSSMGVPFHTSQGFVQQKFYELIGEVAKERHPVGR